MNDLVERLKAAKRECGLANYEGTAAHLVIPQTLKQAELALGEAIAALQCNAEPVADLDEWFAGNGHYADKVYEQLNYDSLKRVYTEAEVRKLLAAQAIPEGMCLVPRDALAYWLAGDGCGG